MAQQAARGVIIAGTDTDIGKTVFAAGLAACLDWAYVKPVQSGTEPATDRQTAKQLGARANIPERYCLALPASPHLSAEVEDVEIEPDTITLPTNEGNLVVEGAGGLLVPLTRTSLQIELFAKWRLPLILCARTSLGTINHTLMSIEALKRRDITVIGIVFIGDDHPDNRRTIGDFSETPDLGRLPHLNPLTSQSLRTAMEHNIDLDRIRGAA